MKTVALVAALSFAPACLYGSTPQSAATAARVDAAEAAAGAAIVYAGRQELETADAPNTSGSYADGHTATGGWLTTGGLVLVTAGLTGFAINEIEQLARRHAGLH
jgi:hypothetical protein